MGVRVTLAGRDIEVEEYTLDQDSTPLEADDSSGGVGEFMVRTPNQPNIYESYNADCVIHDSDRGSLVGTVDSIERDDSSGMWIISGPTRLGKLNLFDVQARPFTGILREAVAYYLGLAGITDDWVVEPDVENIWVAAPGWYGELWYHFKQMVIAAGVELTLTGGVIRVRAPRQLTTVQGFSTERSLNFNGVNLAQSVEVYNYNIRTLENEPVYPPYGFVDSEDILTFTAGEVTEFDLELQASVVDFTEPVMVSSVDKFEMYRSVYAVSTSDGVTVTPSEFRRHGGYVTFELGEDTKSLFVRARGPVGIRDKDNKYVDRFSFSLGKRVTDSGSEDNPDADNPEYPTLRVMGNGVEFAKELLTFPTGVPEYVTDNEVGITVDNPFVLDRETAHRIGIDLATKYGTAYLELAGSFTEFLDSGNSEYSGVVSWNDVGNKYNGLSFNQVFANYQGFTWDRVKEYEWDSLTVTGTYHSIGNAAGARVWDESSNHWFRVRTAGISRGPISYSADPDTLVGDVHELFSQYTYQEIQDANAGLTYQQIIGKGVAL